MSRNRPRGRRPKFTYETVDKVANFLRVGNTLKVSAAASGIAECTFYSWVQAAEDAREAGSETPLQRYFLESIARAREEAEAVLIQHVHNAARKDWRAAAWLASRRNPSDWGEIVRQQTLGKDNQPVDPKEAPRVLVVPPHIDDIHEWSKRAADRVQKARDERSPPDAS